MITDSPVLESVFESPPDTKGSLSNVKTYLYFFSNLGSNIAIVYYPKCFRGHSYFPLLNDKRETFKME